MDWTKAFSSKFTEGYWVWQTPEKKQEDKRKEIFWQ